MPRKRIELLGLLLAVGLAKFKKISGRYIFMYMAKIDLLWLEG